MTVPPFTCNVLTRNARHMPQNSKKAPSSKGREGLAARGTTLVKARNPAGVHAFTRCAITGASGSGYLFRSMFAEPARGCNSPAARNRFAAPTGSLDAAIRWLLVPVIACFKNPIPALYHTRKRLVNRARPAARTRFQTLRGKNVL